MPPLAVPALLAAPLLHGLPWPTLAAGAAAVVLLGVPHGAPDHRRASPPPGISAVARSCW